MTGPQPRPARTARERARAGTMADLMAAARRQLAETGIDGLSLRSVARELGVVSSAVYRYVSNRDELITLLVLDAYEAMATRAEDADRRAAATGADPGTRWLAVAFAVLDWARLHPHEYGMLYASTAPVETPDPHDSSPVAVRLWRVILSIVDAAIASGSLRPPERPFGFDGLLTPEAQVFSRAHASPFDDALVRATALFTSLIGSVSATLFSRLRWLSDDDDRLFALTVATSAEGVGLELPLPRRGDLWSLDDILPNLGRDTPDDPPS